MRMNRRGMGWAVLGLGCLALAWLRADGDDPLALVKQLGDPAVEVREAALKALKAQGERAEPALREATLSGDPEVVIRAEEALAALALARKDAALKAVTIALTASKSTYRADEPVRLTAVFTNTGKDPVVLLRRGIASPISGYANAYLEVTDAEGVPVPPWRLPGGKATAVTSKQVVELAPGASGEVALLHPSSWRAPKPGRYTVTLRYRSGMPAAGFSVDASVGDAMARLPSGEIVSEPITLEIVP